MSSTVLDASAILAVVNGERGQERVIPHLRGGIVSAVNFSEVLKKSIERGLGLAATRLHLENFNLVIVPFDDRHAVGTAELWPVASEHGWSFADRACLALGIARGLPVLTADSRLAKAQLAVRVEMIR